LFLVDRDVVLDAHGLCVLPGWYAGHTFGQGACLGMFFSEFKVGGWGLTWSAVARLGVVVGGKSKKGVGWVGCEGGGVAW
jgi:hypothetical protein